MTVAAISSVTSSFAALPVSRVQGFVAPTPAAASQTATAAKTVNFGPAVTVNLSPQAQSLIASLNPQTNAATAAANANNAAAAQNASNSQAPSPGALALTYQATAEQVWVQVLGSMGLTQQQFNALPASQRISAEDKATNLAEIRMGQETKAPAGVTSAQQNQSISLAIQAILGA